MNIKNLPLIVGISLPILLIAIVSLVIFIPSLSVKPQYSFIYVANDGFYDYDQFYKNTYVVENEHIELKPVPVQKDVIFKVRGDAPTLYFYDVKNNTSRKITFEEAQEYLVDAGPSSPDGYTVTYRYRTDGIFDLFGSRGNNGNYIISKGRGSKKLTSVMFTDQNYYQQNLTLVGWVK